MSACSLRICVSLAAWFWLTPKTMALPNSWLIGSRRPLARKVWQNRRLVASEKNFFSKSFWKKLSASFSGVPATA